MSGDDATDVGGPHAPRRLAAEAGEMFARARLAAGRVVERAYRFGGEAVRLSFAGPALLDKLGRAFAPLVSTDASGPGLEVRIWDARSTGTTVPGLAVPVDATGRAAPRYLIRSEQTLAVVQPVEGAVSVLDLARGVAFYGVVDADAVSVHEITRPLRFILAWWLGARGRVFVHAAAVGTPAGGVLLAGKGGAGKSTTAFACVAQGFRYVGDDYVLITDGAPPLAHAVYGTGSLTSASLDRLPGLEPAAGARGPGRDDDKTVVFVGELAPSPLADTLPIRAVLLPEVTGRHEPRLTEASPAGALAVMAASTVFQLPGMRQPALDAMQRLLARSPVFRLELGDVAANPPAIRALLERLRPAA